jgi:hypothetical protein
MDELAELAEEVADLDSRGRAGARDQLLIEQREGMPSLAVSNGAARAR